MLDRVVLSDPGQLSQRLTKGPQGDGVASAGHADIECSAPVAGALLMAGIAGNRGMTMGKKVRKGSA
jgi:hypothetical protein